MNKEFLSLIPTHYKCPVCEEWHEWEEKRSLQDISYSKYENVIVTCDRYMSRNYYQISSTPIDLRLRSNRFGYKKIKITDMYTNDTDCSVLFFINEDSGFDLELGFRYNKEDYESVIKEKSTNKKVYNFGFEFGRNDDPNVAITPIGVAVKSDNNWKVYSADSNSLINIGDTEVNSLPMFIIPATTLQKGNLIKNFGKYYFVNNVESEYIEALCVNTSEIIKIVPTKSIFGFECYSKVVSLADYMVGDIDSKLEKIAVITSVCSQNVGRGIIDFAPLMLLKENNNQERSFDDIIEMIFICSMMIE